MSLSRMTLMVIATITLSAGAAEPTDEPHGPDLLANPQFVDYWLDGRAEVTRYDLEQARHGEIHAGDVVLIFETAGLPPEKDAETDAPERDGPDAVPVMRLGFTKRFTTGVEPYSIMTTVRTPIRFNASPRTLESVTSVQEWSGASWLQLELRGDEYEVTGLSDVQSKTGKARALEAVWLEDEIWTRIRLAPSTLPKGMVRIIPGGEQSRLRERPLAVETARASLDEESEGALVYALRYPGLERKLAIRFEKEFPHAILGWDEWARDPAGHGAEGQTTHATRAESIRLDYRNRTGKDDAAWRKKLGLD